MAEWDDYLIQDTCRDSGGASIPGDPLTCASHSDLTPADVVFAGFKYSDTSRTFAIQSLPRASPTGPAAYVWFDSGNGADGKGQFDLDDPHCKVPGTLCAHGGDVDIVDIVEAHRDGAGSVGLVSAAMTAHVGTGGYLAFNGNGVLGDAWLHGAVGSLGVPTALALTVYRDAAANTATYLAARALDLPICSTPAGAPAGACSALGYNRWFLVDQLYLGDGKTFRDVLVSMHTVDFATLDSCAGHLELYLHSKEYGLMSHQTWRRLGCDPSPPADLGCASGAAEMIVSPFTLYYGSTPLTLERKACTRAVTSSTPYALDGRSLAAPASATPYPNAQVIDSLGYGNLVLNAHMSWPGTGVGAWQTFDAVVSKVEAPVTAAAPRNEAARVSCDGDCAGSSLYQDVPLAVRAPGWPGAVVDFGARVALISGTSGSGSVYLWQFTASGQANGSTSVPFTTTAAWPDPSGTFVTGSALLLQNTASVRIQIYVNSLVAYAVDDVYVTRR